MSKFKDILKYIQLYTGCTDHALKRIDQLLIENREKIEPEIKIIEKIVVVDKILEKGYKPNIDIDSWSNKYFDDKSTSYEEINKRSNTPQVCRLRNHYCKDAYTYGFGASEIARYLKRNHTTILYSIHKSKTK